MTSTGPHRELQNARDALDDLSGHLSRYTDPARLAAHLRSHAHDKTVRTSTEECLFLLRADHETAHRGDLAAARNRCDAAEDTLAELTAS